MWLFTSMASPTISDISEWWYLGSSVQRIKLLKTKKIHEMLGILSIKRPELDICDPLDIRSIQSYIARENLECAIYCDPETPVVQVERLCRIANWNIEPWEYIYISRHPNYAKALNELNKSPRDLLAYFEVNIWNTEQDTLIADSHIEEFRDQFEKAQQIILERWS